MGTARTLPSGVELHSKTGIFTAETVPDKLKSAHSLKAGTWGFLIVNRGQVRYFRENKAEPLTIMTDDEPFLIVPEDKHYVRLSDDAEFYLEFYK